MNKADFYRSILGLLEPDLIQQKRVAVVGLGSGGARVAAELGRLGVNLLLVERPGERMEEHNILRHLLGYGSLSKLKLQETASYIRNLNPSVQIECRPIDVAESRQRLARLLKAWRPDAIAVCTDNEPSKHAINEVAVHLGIPQTGGAVYDGGIGGEVFRVAPGQPCYGCLAAHLRLERQAPKSTSNYNLSGEPAHQTIGALNMDIQQIALIQCRMTLQLLLGTSYEELGIPPEVNLCVFANRVVPGVFARPWHCEFYAVPRNENCLVCGAGGREYEHDARRIIAGLNSSSVPSPL